MTSSGFGGTIASVQLTDAIQLICMSGRTAALNVSVGPKRGTLFFQNGDIIHAEYGELIGEEALFEIISWRGGEFALAARAPSGERTIFDSWQGLLLEAARRQDERKMELEQEQGAPPQATTVSIDVSAEQPGEAPTAEVSAEEEEEGADVFDFGQLETPTTPFEPATEEQAGEPTIGEADTAPSAPEEEVPEAVKAEEPFDFGTLEGSEAAPSTIETELTPAQEEEGIGAVKFEAEEPTPEEEGWVEAAEGLTVESEAEEAPPEPESWEIREASEESVEAEAAPEVSEEVEVGKMEFIPPITAEDISEGEGEEEIAEQPMLSSTGDERVSEETTTQQMEEEAVEAEMRRSEFEGFVAPEQQKRELPLDQELIGRALDDAVRRYMQSWPEQVDQVRFDALPADTLPPYIYRHFLCRFLQLAMRVIRLEDMPFDFRSERLTQAIRDIFQILQDNWLISRDHYRQIVYDALYFELARSIDPARALARFLYERTEGDIEQTIPFLRSMIQNGLIGEHYTALLNDLKLQQDRFIHPTKMENFIRALLYRRSEEDSLQAVRQAMERIQNIVTAQQGEPRAAIETVLVAAMLESRGLVHLAEFVKVEQKMGKQALSLTELDAIVERYHSLASYLPIRRRRTALGTGQTETIPSVFTFESKEK